MDNNVLQQLSFCAYDHLFDLQETNATAKQLLGAYEQIIRLETLMKADKVVDILTTKYNEIAATIKE
jgi:hypothetical protein